MNADYSTVDTPIGPFTTIVDDRSVVIASGWTDDLELLLPQIHSTLKPESVRERAELGAVTDAVKAYHRGDLSAVDSVAVEQRSGPFLNHAWEVLRTIEPGDPVTYSEFAARAGRPNSPRGAASACQRNAAALFVPCHRVVRVGGALGGFRWGLDVKRWLIAHEE